MAKFLISLFLISGYSYGFLTAQTHPDLGAFTDYSSESKVWLASAGGQVLVNPQFPIVIGAMGELEWKVADGTEVAKDDVLFLTEAEKIRLSERELALKKSRYPNALSDLEETNRESKKGLKKTVVELRTKLSSLEMTPTERELLGADFERRLAEEREELEAEIVTLERKLESEYFAKALEDDRIALNLELDNADYVHRDLIRGSEVRAVVAGKVVVETKKAVKPDSVVGKIIKDKSGEAQLEISDPSIANLPPEQIGIEVPGEDGLLYSGRYSRTLDEEAFERPTKIYVFDLEKQEGQEEIPESLSGSRIFRVYRLLAEPGRIIPKEKLLFEHPEEIAKSGWASFVSKRWPGTKLVYVGPRDLVIREDDEN